MKDNNHLQLKKKKEKEDRQTKFRLKSQKISRQCLDYATELDDASLKNLIDNIYESSSSEIINGSQLSETPNDCMENPVLAVSSSSSSPSTMDESGKVEFSSISSRSLGKGRSKCLEVDMTVSNLRQAEDQVLNSTNIDDGHKHLLYTLVEMIIEELHRMAGDKDGIAPPEIVSRKTHLILLSLASCILVAFMILLFSSGAPGSFIEPPPT